METKIKNTLFRFVAFRKPEQINDDKKVNLFVHHPHPTQSELYATTQAEFNTKITAFETNNLVKTKDQLKALNQPLYDLAFWVLQNRESITATSFQAKMDELGVTTSSTLSEADENVAWDNFIYQITTHKDDIAREAAMTLLYGNYLLKQQTLQNGLIANASTSSFTGTTPPPPNPNTLTVNQFRRILQARIVRPDFLAFPPVTTTPPASNVGDEPLSLQTQQQFRTALNQLNSKSAIANLETLKKELTSANKKYNKLEAQNLKAYDTQYQSDYNDYLASINNSNSSLTGGDGNSSDGDSTTPVPPPPLYNYSSLVQLDASRLESHLSPESFEFLNEINSEEVETFSELNDLIAQKISEETTASFRLPSTTTTFWSIGGVTVPYEPTNPTNNYSYVIQPIKMSTANKYKFNLAIKVPNIQMDIQSINYSVYNGANLLKSSIVGDFNNNDSIISGVLFKLGVLIPSGTTQVVINANITFNNGAKYNLIQTVVLSEEALGMLEDVSNPDGQQQEGGGSGNPVPPVVILPTDNRPSWKKFGVTRLGIADYRKIEQSICCYVPGEVSHIENIMAREYKERSTKRLRRSETTSTTEKSTETENLTDSTTTERNEMHQEIAKMQQQSMDLSTSAGVHFGSSSSLYSADINTAFAYHNSKEESNNMARTEAREKTERAMERVVAKVREERVQKIIDEFTEENKHGFDNREGDKHISGVYRWVDKIYKNEIFNYGKRLMYEFMVPEPAKFQMLFSNNFGKFSMDIPVDPRKTTPKKLVNTTRSTLSNEEIKLDESNYQEWASAYNADVDAPPPSTMIVGKAYSGEAINGKGHFNWNDLKVLEGYKVSNINCAINIKKHSNNNTRITVIIDNQPKTFVINTAYAGFDVKTADQSFTVTPVGVTSDTIPVSVVTWDLGAVALNVNATLTRSTELFQKWQNETFNKIIQAYEDKLAIYEQKYAAFLAEQKQSRAINPMFYRQFENTVLRKNCISYLLGYDKIGRNFQKGAAIKEHEISPNAMNAEGTIVLSDANGGVTLSKYASVVKFMEQAFEWEIMSYIFYPFYWGNKENWDKLYGQQTDDVLFTKFLQSGMARVILTVRPGFEDAVNWFLETGQVWNGLSSPPVIGDDLYLSIVDELQEPEYTVEGSWETRIPSTLTVIQDSGVGLHAEGLPCACKQEIKEEFSGSTNTLEGATSEGGVGYWKVNADENQTPPIYVPNPNPTE